MNKRSLSNLNSPQDLPEARPLLLAVLLGAKPLGVGGKQAELVAQVVVQLHFKVLVLLAENLVEERDTLTARYPHLEVGAVE